MYEGYNDEKKIVKKKSVGLVEFTSQWRGLENKQEKQKIIFTLLLSNTEKKLSRTADMTYWGGKGVEILVGGSGKLLREGDLSKEESSGYEVSEATAIQDLVVLFETQTFTLSKKGSTAVL